MTTGTLILVVAAIVVAAAAMIAGFLASRDDEQQAEQHPRCYVCGEGWATNTPLFLISNGPPKVWSCIIDMKVEPRSLDRDKDPE
jgi:hypothetical protein